MGPGTWFRHTASGSLEPVLLPQSQISPVVDVLEPLNPAVSVSPRRYQLGSTITAPFARTPSWNDGGEVNFKKPNKRVQLC